MSEDAIGRQAAIDAVIDFYDNMFDENDSIEKRLADLPSVHAEPKTGHWIVDFDKWGDVITTVNGYRCSECGMFDVDNDLYCPNCGAKMEGEV